MLRGKGNTIHRFLTISSTKVNVRYICWLELGNTQTMSALGLSGLSGPFSSFDKALDSGCGECTNLGNWSDAELKLFLSWRDRWCVGMRTALTGILTWQSASEQTLPTADNSVPLLEPQKRHASELLVVGLPWSEQKKKQRKILLKNVFYIF